MFQESNLPFHNILRIKNNKLNLFCYLSALSVCLVLTSCLSVPEKEKHKHFWYGSKPFEKRQTIEAYKRDTIPAIEKFLTRISQADAGKLTLREDDQDRPCGENNNGYDYWSPNISGKPIKVADVIKAEDKYLVPAGFTVKKERRYEDGEYSIFWLNPKDGGYVYTMARPGSHTGIYYISGCRPSDGSATPSPSPTPTRKLPETTFPQTNTPPNT